MERKFIKKFCLKIFIDDGRLNWFPLKIKIVYFHPSFSWVSTKNTNNKDFPMFQSKNDFILYPFDNGVINEYLFSIPFTDLNEDKTISKVFISDYARKDFLKELYICMEDFGNNWEGFKNMDNSNKKIIVRNKFWLM